MPGKGEKRADGSLLYLLDFGGVALLLQWPSFSFLSSLAAAACSPLLLCSPARCQLCAPPPFFYEYGASALAMTGQLAGVRTELFSFGFLFG